MRLKRQWTARYIHSRTDSSREDKQFGMAESEFDGAESAHGDSDDCAIRSSCRYEKLALNVRNEIVHNVIFVAILPPLRRIHVVRFVALGHNKDQTSLSKQIGRTQGRETVQI